MALLQDLQTRGFLKDCTDSEGLTRYLQSASTEVPALYIGFDCTASALHAGSLIQIMLLRRLRAAGVRPVILLGTATATVGDPSGKDVTRKMLTPEDVKANSAGVRACVERFFRTENGGEGPAPEFVDNGDWLNGLGYLEYLRAVGPHFSVNRMLTMDSVKRRLDREQTLSFLEFNYMTLQAYDFVVLSRGKGVRMQAGGSDQWGNIVSGVELSRRMSAGNAPELFGITTPLLETADGKKMGKTEAGAIWLDPLLTSPYEYRQYWRNTDDRDVGKFLRLFTELPEEQIHELEKAEGKALNDAKGVLADECVRLAHGSEAMHAARATAAAMFGGGYDTANAQIPKAEITPEELTRGLRLTEALTRLGLCSGSGEAKRLIAGGGVQVNKAKEEDPLRLITQADADTDGYIFISAGKKKHGALVRGS